MLSFEGDEIYFKEEPYLIGKTFGEALSAYEDSSVIGLLRGGRPLLNLPMDTRIAPGDQIIVIAEDNEATTLSGLTELKIDESAIQAGRTRPAAPERTLMLGWNRHALSVIKELDNYVAPGSQTMVVANSADGKSQLARCRALLKNQSVSFTPGDTTNRPTLDELAIPTFHHIIVLSRSDALGTQEADAEVLVTLLHLRDIRERSGQAFSVVSEMLDVRNRNLAEVTHADDFIVSDQLVSLVLSQVSQNRHLTAVFAELFDPEGCEIYLKPAEDYVSLGQPLNFYTVVEAARRRGEIAIGYRLSGQARDAAQSYGVVLNPEKSKQVTLADGDKIIVVADR